MLINISNHQINIIDWSETVITHPFFALNGCLWNAVYFSDLTETAAVYKKLQATCAQPWLDLFDEEKLLTAFGIANQLLGAYTALGYERLYIATQDERLSTQKEKKGAIAGCLRTFINKN